MQERALRILYCDEQSSYVDLLKRDDGFTVHERNIQLLLTEMFKAKNNIEPHLQQDIFEASHYQGPTLRSSKYFSKPKINTVKYGERSLQYLGTRLWDQLPRNIQVLNYIEKFKYFID